MFALAPDYLKRLPYGADPPPGVFFVFVFASEIDGHKNTEDFFRYMQYLWESTLFHTPEAVWIIDDCQQEIDAWLTRLQCPKTL